MHKRATIECTAHSTFGRTWCTYHWVGPKTGAVEINRHVFRRDGRHMPWPLREVDYDVLMQRGTYVRTDVGFGLPALATAGRVAAHRLLGGIKARLIITAMVWGIGYVPEYEAPDWRHLKGRR
jgi:hypothetical protein